MNYGSLNNRKPLADSLNTTELFGMKESFMEFDLFLQALAGSLLCVALATIAAIAHNLN